MRTVTLFDTYASHVERIISGLPSVLGVRALSAAGLLIIVLAATQLAAGMYVIGDPATQLWFYLGWSVGLLVAILMLLSSYLLYRRRISSTNQLTALTFVILRDQGRTLDQEVAADLDAAEESAVRLTSITEELNTRRERQLAAAVWSVRGDLLDRIREATAPLGPRKEIQQGGDNNPGSSPYRQESD